MLTGHLKVSVGAVVEMGAEAGAVVFAGWVGRKVLGPTLDQIGDDLRDRYSGFRAENAARIGRNAQAKLGDAADEEGTVPPRVALQVLEEGSWCDAPVMAEYFGGILAASRTPDGDDDRGVSWAGLVSRLSTFDVYLHYLIYDALRRELCGQTDVNLGLEAVRLTTSFYFPAGGVLSAMGRTPTGEDIMQIVLPSVTALIREDLCAQRYWTGPPDFLREQEQIDAPDYGIICQPSMSGIELFLWAHGHGRLPANAILNDELDFESQADLGHVLGARLVSKMQIDRAERIQAEKERAAPGFAPEPKP